MSIGRSPLLPLANRNDTSAWPVRLAFTVHCTKLPATLSVSTKPRPVNPPGDDFTTPVWISASSAWKSSSCGRVTVSRRGGGCRFGGSEVVAGGGCGGCEVVESGLVACPSGGSADTLV